MFIATEDRCGAGLVRLQSLSAAIRILACLGKRHNVAGLRDCRVEQRHAGQRIGMIANVAAVSAFDHHNAGVVVDRYNPLTGTPASYCRTMLE